MEDRQVEVANVVSVGDKVNRDDFPTRNREAEDDTRPSPRRQHLQGQAVNLRAADYGPDSPTRTPPGARTIATVTPGITGVGGCIASAPSRRAFSNDARASATW